MYIVRRSDTTIACSRRSLGADSGHIVYVFLFPTITFSNMKPFPPRPYFHPLRDGPASPYETDPPPTPQTLGVSAPLARTRASGFKQKSLRLGCFPLPAASFCRLPNKLNLRSHSEIPPDACGAAQGKWLPDTGSWRAGGRGDRLGTSWLRETAVCTVGVAARMRRGARGCGHVGMRGVRSSGSTRTDIFRVALFWMEGLLKKKKKQSSNAAGYAPPVNASKQARREKKKSSPTRAPQIKPYTINAKKITTGNGCKKPRV